MLTPLEKIQLEIILIHRKIKKAKAIPITGL